MANYQDKASWPATLQQHFTGVITHWNAAKGFGFIRRDDGRADLFCHINQVADDVEELRVGQRVRFEPGISSRTTRPEAKDVRVIEAKQ
jgi:cold shock protein